MTAECKCNKKKKRAQILNEISNVLQKPNYNNCKSCKVLTFTIRLDHDKYIQNDVIILNSKTANRYSCLRVINEEHGTTAKLKM